MRARYSHYLELLHYSYWFIPAVMAVIAVLLGLITTEVDQRGIGTGLLINLGLAYTGGPDGASTLLSTIAGSMITVAGTTFSIAIVAMILASTQFGPRMIRNFMRDTSNQVTLGVYIATFIYSLIVLRTVRSVENNAFVPHLSVSVAVLLSVISLGVLIYFIHHASRSIQAVNIIADVSQDLTNSINRLYPGHMGHEPTPGKEGKAFDDIPTEFGAQARPVRATKSGYLQAIDEESLMDAATVHDVLIRLKYRPGAFILAGVKIADVWPPEKADAKLVELINGTFILGAQRTQFQDVEYDINQLVEMAIRSLSPAINDPFTAMMCLDRLAQGLSLILKRTLPSPYRYDKHNQLRVITNTSSFDHITKASFNQIRQYGRTSVSVTIRMLEVITMLAEFVTTAEEREALRHQAEMIEKGCREAISEDADREGIHHRYLAALAALEEIKP